MQNENIKNLPFIIPPISLLVCKKYAEILFTILSTVNIFFIKMSQNKLIVLAISRVALENNQTLIRK